MYLQQSIVLNKNSLTTIALTLNRSAHAIASITQSSLQILQLASIATNIKDIIITIIS